jgi:hypothetical protein
MLNLLLLNEGINGSLKVDEKLLWKSLSAGKHESRTGGSDHLANFLDYENCWLHF